MRWERPTPVAPATTAGTQPPLGVTDTTHPSASAASIEVVPAPKRLVVGHQSEPPSVAGRWALSSLG